MNKTSLVLPLLIGALVVSPAAAYADHSQSEETEATASVSASATVETGRPGVLNRLMDDHKDRPKPENMASGTAMHKERMGSTTRPAAGERKGQAIEKVQEKGSEKIDERIARLKEQLTRISAMVRLSDDQKASISAEINAQITALTELKTKIASETSTTTLKELTQSITKSYRVYAVTMPKAAITAAADRIMTVVAQMESLSTKISARIEAAKTAGVDVSAAETAYADFTAKIADAKTQAQAAASAVAGLSADNGDVNIQASNTEALKAAKTKIDAAQTDLKAARKDVDTILKAIKGKGEVKAEASATTN